MAAAAPRTGANIPGFGIVPAYPHDFGAPAPVKRLEFARATHPDTRVVWDMNHAYAFTLLEAPGGWPLGPSISALSQPVDTGRLIEGDGAWRPPLVWLHALHYDPAAITEAAWPQLGPDPLATFNVTFRPLEGAPPLPRLAVSIVGLQNSFVKANTRAANGVPRAGMMTFKRNHFLALLVGVAPHEIPHINVRRVYMGPSAGAHLRKSRVEELRRMAASVVLGYPVPLEVSSALCFEAWQPGTRVRNYWDALYTALAWLVWYETERKQFVRGIRGRSLKLLAALPLETARLKAYNVTLRSWQSANERQGRAPMDGGLDTTAPRQPGTVPPRREPPLINFEPIRSTITQLSNIAMAYGRVFEDYENIPGLLLSDLEKQPSVDLDHLIEAACSGAASGQVVIPPHSPPSGTPLLPADARPPQAPDRRITRSAARLLGETAAAAGAEEEQGRPSRRRKA